jgi:hypothetical protein
VLSGEFSRVRKGWHKACADARKKRDEDKVRVRRQQKDVREREHRLNTEKEADKAFSRHIRSRDMRCMDTRPGHICKGNLQCMHGFRRDYRRVRFDPRNAWAGCYGSHKWYTHHPEEWTDEMKRRMGEDLYEHLRVLALASVPIRHNYRAIVDLGYVLAEDVVVIG